MNMKKLIFVAVLLVFVATQVIAVTVTVAPRAVSLTAKENESVIGYAKVVAPGGFEKKIKIVNVPEWLKVEPLEFTISRTNHQQVKLTASSSGLKPGSYNANLTVRNVTENDKPDFATLAVLFSVLSGKNELSAIPRSIEMKPGVSRTISISNPTNSDLSAKISSSSFWIQVYPERIDIPEQSTAIVWAKMTEKYLPGGNYSSTIICDSPIGKLVIPVKTVVESGIEFNPDTISDSGPITITNKLKKPVIVRPVFSDGVSFDLKRIDIAPGKSKIVKVTFTTNTKPDYIGFSITGALNNAHNIKVSK